MMIESAPAHSNGQGKGKGSKGGKGKAVTPNTSKAFMDHKKAMAEKRAAFKRQAEADQLAMREAARNKKQKKAERFIQQFAAPLVRVIFSAYIEELLFLITTRNSRSH